MTEDHEQHVADMRNELTALRSQVETLMRRLDAKGDDDGVEALAARFVRELEQCGDLVGRNARKAYDAGVAGVEEVSGHVRRNPLASLAIAFGAGTMLACIASRMKQAAR